MISVDDGSSVLCVSNLAVNLGDTDAAGVLYFASLFPLAHGCYEAFLAEGGFSLSTILSRGEIAIPIVHAEAEFKAPMRPGDRFDITLRAAEVGTSSYTLDYLFTNDRNMVLAQAQTTHVVIEISSGKPVPIPEGLIVLLK